jgi:hypothetical protein
MNEQEARRARADELRKKIATRKNPPNPGATEDHPEMLPGESPNEYIERRVRELKKKKRESTSGLDERPASPQSPADDQR